MATHVESAEIKNDFACRCSDGKVLPLDSRLLGKYSKYFQALVHSHMQETATHVVRLDLISSDTLAVLMDILQRVQVDERVELREAEAQLLEDLLLAADYLDVDVIREVCDQHLSQAKVDEDKLVSLLGLLETFPALPGLQRLLTSYLCEHVIYILSLEQVVEGLSAELLQAVLGSPETRVDSEMQLVCLVDRWLSLQEEAARSKGKVGSEDMREVACSLASLIKVPELEEAYKEFHVSVHQQDFAQELKRQIFLYRESPREYVIAHPEQGQIRRPVDVVVSVGCHDRLPSTMLFTMSVSYCRMTPEVGEKTFDGFDFKEQMSVSVRLPSLCLREFAVSTIGQFLFIAGGQDSFSDSGQNALRHVYQLNLENMEWTEVSSLNSERCLFTLATMRGRLYAVGGINGSGEISSVEFYDPQEDKWHYTTPLPYAVHEHAGCVLQDCHYYVSGGHNGLGHVASVSCLQEDSQLWVECAPLLYPRSYHTMAGHGGQVYVVGGCQLDNGTVRDCLGCEVYSPRTNQWTELSTIYPCPYSSCLTSFAHLNSLVCLGGYSFGQRGWWQGVNILDTGTLAWRQHSQAFQDPKMKEVVAHKVVMKERNFRRHVYRVPYQ